LNVSLILIQDPSLSHITAFAMDPAGIPSSRAFNDVPRLFKASMFIIGHFILPVAQYFTQALNSPANAGQELAALAIGPKGEGVRGYFVRLQQKDSSEESRNESKQREVWAACEKWVKLKPSDTVLK
jgi:WW domain-containing oxidoreductase